MLIRDREKFNHIIEGTNRLIASDSTKLSVLETRQHEMGILCDWVYIVEDNLKGLREKNDALRVKINNQEFSPEQVEQIRKASAMWKEKITDVTSQKQILSARIEELINLIDEQASSIDKMISHYHELLLGLQLLPSSTPLANGVDYRLILEHVDDVSSVSTRNVQHYQTQILSNSMLTRLVVCRWCWVMICRVCWMSIRNL